MNNITGLSYSPNGAFNRYILKKKRGYIHLFVEDTGKEFEYEEILERMFQESHMPKFQIFAMNGKKYVEDAFSRTISSTDKVFFIADGDFDRALGKHQVSAQNFVYLRKYNIESYLIYKPAVITFMRKKLGKEINETKQIVDYESWEGTVSPYLKNVFALHCLVQQNCQSEENVGKGPGYFFDPIGFPNYARYNAYLTTINSQCSITQTDIDNQCNTLEEMYGTEIGAFVCGKYLIHSLLYYLKSKCPKRNLDIDSLREYLISNFDISLLDYIKERIEAYIALDSR